MEDNIKFLTRLFYGAIGVAASLAFFLTLYWALRLDSSITSIITNTYVEPIYFWLYMFFTLGVIVLFGVNAALLVYRWRKFGPPRLKGQAGTGLGSLVGIAASACPVCGSTILYALGIAGGLAAFPLQGLELKVLSFILLALPVWLVRKDLEKLECGDSTCPIPKDHSFKETDKSWLIILFALITVMALISWNMLRTEPVIAKFFNQLYNENVSETKDKLLNEVIAKVLSEKGFQSKIFLDGSVLRLVEEGVIDRQKLEAIYQERGGLPSELKTIFDEPSLQPMVLTRENANYYVNLLWPLGLANKMSTNERSPINGKSLFNFASTGGWNLGREENGGAYFNKFQIVELSPEQEALVTKIAENSYRPCCNNSTFFQDCNHGSALLGLLQLGAAQGLTEDELYREALAFNSFWFPDNYVQTALYFKVVKGIDWEDIDPKIIMSRDFSSISGWYENVDKEIKRLSLIPQSEKGASCGV